MWWAYTGVAGSLGSIASALALAWRSRRDTGRQFVAVNAPSQWVWGRRALRQPQHTWRYTGVGLLVHHLSSLFWASIYAAWLVRRRPSPVAAAAIVTALAAGVDLRAVPERLSPGFQHPLRRSSLCWVYVAFGAGLAAGAWWVGSRPRWRGTC